MALTSRIARCRRASCEHVDERLTDVGPAMHQRNAGVSSRVIARAYGDSILSPLRWRGVVGSHPTSAPTGRTVTTHRSGPDSPRSAGRRASRRTDRGRRQGSPAAFRRARSFGSQSERCECPRTVDIGPPAMTGLHDRVLVDDRQYGTHERANTVTSAGGARRKWRSSGENPGGRIP